MIVKIYPENPNEKQIAQVIAVLERDGVIIYPTDSVYAFGCSLRSRRALDRLRQIRGKNLSRLSVVFDDLSLIAGFARVSNVAFRMLKRNTPGPFTFILPASSNVPDNVLGNRKTFGVRIPDNAIATTIVRELGVPLASTSVRDDDEVLEYTTDPELIHERFGHLVDLVIDGGYGGNEPTTVVDLTGDDPEILREGKGAFHY